MKRISLVATVALTLLSACVSSSKFDEQVARNEQLTQELAGLNLTLEEAQAQNRTLEGDLDASRKTIESLDLHTRNLAAEVEQERLAREATMEKMQSSYSQLQRQMQSEIERGEITISELEGRLTVNMVDSILFPSGSAKIKKEGLEVLKRVADIVKEVDDKDIEVEGHTDNVPISDRIKKTFPSNWELSTARAVTVVRFLEEHGVNGDRLTAVGHGEFRPIADNTTRKGRAQNRRIQIVLVPKTQRIVKPAGN